MNALVIVNDQPSGSERPYSALHLAAALARREDAQARVFLIGDAAATRPGSVRPTGSSRPDPVPRGRS